MIVDAHTRIWESTDQLGRAAEPLRRRRDEPWDRPDASSNAHDEAMQPVENAIILGLENKTLDSSISMDQVAGYVGRNPRKYLGFAGLDPTVADPVARLDRATVCGLVGVTISPASQGFHPTDTRAMALYEACEARRLPIFIDNDPSQARDSRMEFAQPYLLDEIARSFPDLRLVIASLGHPWTDQCLTLVRKHPTLFADVSGLVPRPWQLYTALLAAHQEGAMGQILFGSNFPFCTPQQAIMNIYSVNTVVQGTHLPIVPREQLRSIVERDTLRCLGLRGGEE